jgi:hypothetical protein
LSLHKSIAVIGLGGIGSWFMFFVNDLIEHEQISTNHIFQLVDDDIIEDKNIFYQYYRDFEIFDTKAEALCTRFDKRCYFPKIERITDTAQLKNFDIIISCVDNNEFRNMLYDFVMENPKVYWIEMRSEGSNFLIQQAHPKHTLESLKQSIGTQTATSTSCQHIWDIERQQIQQGNKIVAAIGSQWLLTHLRGLNPIRATYIAAT